MLKNLTKLIQISAVFMILLSIIQYAFKILPFIEPITTTGLNIVTNFIPPVINGVDCTLLLLILPWIILVIITGIIFNTLEKTNEKVNEIIDAHMIRKTSASMEIRKKEKQQELAKKNKIFLLISLKFVKFTLTNLSESEVSAKKEEIERKLFNSIAQLNGKLIEHENFDEEDTFAFSFVSQEDVINYIFKFKQSIILLDNDVQNFGYTLNYRIILDAQAQDTSNRSVLEFLEAAIRTVENNEICTTNSFADKYKITGGEMQNISFYSKGVYSINKIKVELNALYF